MPSLELYLLMKFHMYVSVYNLRFNGYLNTSTSADSLFRLSTRWFMWRMETMALVAITLTSVFCVGFKVNSRIEVFCLILIT